ncbi:helix-turn-helix transcriptional regulator [Conexibacter sp. JD483]|uniref:PadR family transcriptional regulator n=1 Tax=unclassified Conexibacter TaxID=2627773 RepID=UPI00271BBA71|nr:MULTISPECIES: helix-turn-helix transcriptional regulator [unclassified Conexibacter]MDO8185798.1 helix-turn-helix transcriptional regulator [Conexibacter sp. CPCC 205706]MDO8198542.1 helix-turn-helix transcriptional regulator [Conexibacter sp. CPCC 205762]MDR9367628.1 helix-turn-helix transcriptional regulator [Conexibacter sp. JD483]
MSVRQAVLGLVIERPGYGYELDARLTERIGSWRHSETAVYPALLKLARDGMVRETLRRPAHDRVVWYEATDAGRDDFKRWLRKPPSLLPLRDDLHLKISLADEEDLAFLIEQTRAQEQLCLDRLDRLSDAGAEPERLMDPNVEWRAIGHLWMRRTEVAHVTAAIESLQEARSLMRAHLRRRAR